MDTVFRMADPATAMPVPSLPVAADSPIQGTSGIVGSLMGFVVSWKSLGLLVLASPVVLFSFYVLLMIWRVWFSPLSKVPGPRWAAATYLYEVWHSVVKGDFGERRFRELHDRYGPIVRVNPNEIHIDDLDFNLDFFHRKDLNKDDVYYGLFKDSLAGMNRHERHDLLRPMIAPFFLGKSMSLFSQRELGEHLQNLLDRLSDAAESKQALNFSKLFKAYAFDVITRFVMNEKLDLLKDNAQSAEDPIWRMDIDIYRFSALWKVWPVPHLSWLRLAPVTRRWNPMKKLEELVAHKIRLLESGSVKEKEDVEGSSHKDITHTLFHNPKYRAAKGDLHFDSFEPVIAGGEALSHNMAWILFWFLKDQRVAKKIRDELDGLNCDGEHIWSDPRVMRLPYLNAVVKEITRLSTPGWLRSVRMSDTPVAYKNMILPGGTKISATPTLVSKNPSLYDDPTAFYPERWLEDEEKAKWMMQISFNWGTGSRTCLGKELTFHVMKKTAAAIFYNYDISFEPEVLEDQKTAFLNAFHSEKSNPLKLRVAPRSFAEKDLLA